MICLLGVGSLWRQTRVYGHYGNRYRSCSLREYMPINETDQRIYPLWKSTREYTHY